MKEALDIAVSWERLDEGAVEECACFGLLTIRQGNRLLTEGIDGFIDSTRRGPLVSGYHLAEWLAWNWWRLTGEPMPKRMSHDWSFAHSLATIGAGYLWPNISIFSDREHTVLIAKPTHPDGFAPFRFTADQAIILPTRQFVAVVDRFMEQIQGQLRAKAIPLTNFDRIFDELQAERTDSKMAAGRKLEALLGCDPDEASVEEIERLFADAEGFGWDAIQELAADHQPGRSIPRMSDLTALAATIGTDTRPGDIPLLPTTELPPRDQVPAWRHGYETARVLRVACGLQSGPLPDQRLADLSGVSVQVLAASPSAGHVFAFSLDDESGKAGHIVLRSKWATGRRFELARLLGDRLTTGYLNERLLPATRAYTYRQKFQRAFAAELLCPFEALKEQMDGDYSADAREDVAHYFGVSERTVTTLLVNYKCIDRSYLDEDLEILAA